MFNKLVTIGKDAELRFTPNNKAVIGLNCVYDIGWGDNKKAQWIEAVIWGKQAESLAQYLLKGKQIVISADDLEVETYENNGKTGSKLKCRVINIDLVRGGDNQNQQQAPQQQQQAQPQQQNNQGFNDSFDGDMPF